MKTESTTNRAAVAAMAAGVLGVLTAFILYWLVLPGVILGLVAVVLGARSRRTARSEIATVAMTLGLVAILAVPAFLATADSAENWGRDCALDPSHDPNC